MSRVLLADDSAHAQRMGVRILREEGFEVVSVTDGEAALTRLAEADPDIVLVDVFLPGKSGVELCRYVKDHPRHRHARVILTAGMLDTFDEAEAKRAGCDAFIRKPFEASVVVKTVKPLARDAQAERTDAPTQTTSSPLPDLPAPEPAAAEPALKPTSVLKARRAAAETAPAPAEAPSLDPARVRAAVTVALDAAFPALIDELTERVLTALRG